MNNKFVDDYSNYIYINNTAHLGDCVFTLISLYHIKNYIEENDIYIFFFCNRSYHNQLNEFVCSSNIILQPFVETYDMGLNVWIGLDTIMTKSHKSELLEKDFCTFYTVFMNYFYKKIKIPVTINSIAYEDYDLIIRQRKIIQNYPVFKNIQILVINSTALSGQYMCDTYEFDGYVQKLAMHYNILCTKPIKNILCTMNYGLTIKDIASLSINVDIVIAINTGPFVGLLNVYTLNRVKQFYIFDRNIVYTMPKFQMKENITDISLEELQKYIY